MGSPQKAAFKRHTPKRRHRNLTILTSMSLSLLITPGGQLRVECDLEDLPQVSGETAKALEAAFEKSSVDGLLLLASAEIAEELPPAFVFWRSLARQCFHAICQLGESGFPKWQSIAPPPEDELSGLAADAPPMRGLEYLNAALMQTLWNELRELAGARAAAFPG